jgi:hypothetical protein
MTLTAALARDEAITEALRAINDAIGDNQPTQQALQIIQAVKRLRSPVRVTGTKRVDYLDQVQRLARGAYREQGHDPATAGVDTPIGRLKAVTFLRAWRSGKLAWFTEYYLNDQPITVAEIRAAGLAQRPTTRRRQRKGTTK